MNQRGLISEENKTLKNSYNILKTIQDSPLKTCIRIAFLLQTVPNHCPKWSCTFLASTTASIGTASPNSANVRGIRPRMYIEHLLR